MSSLGDLHLEDGQAEAMATLFARCGVQVEKPRSHRGLFGGDVKVASEAAALDAEHPDRDDGAENSQT
jgi:hypothetical protein